MLTPAFSAEHLRGLLPIFYQVTHKVSPVPSFSSRYHRQYKR